MNWTGGRLRRHSELNGKPRRQTFEKSSASGKGPHQITLFNSITKSQNVNEKRRKLNNDALHDTEDPQARDSPSPIHPSSNTVGAHDSSGPPNRLGHLKRQLLETTDWGVVGAARPVQVSFTPKEDLERFGKRRRLTRDDYERLNPTMARTRAHPRLPLEGEIPDQLEIKINGHRLGQKNDDNEGSLSKIISSQSMLLAHEELDNRADVQNSCASKNSIARSASKLSMILSGSQLCFTSDETGRSDTASNAQGNPIPYHRNISSLAGWGSGEPRSEQLQSNGSSSIFPQPESPVRRRFTIDDQAAAERQGRFGAEVGSFSQAEDGVDGLDQHDKFIGPSLSTPAEPHLGLFSEPYRDIQCYRSSQIGVDTSRTPMREHIPNFPSSSKGEKEYTAPMRIFGQPVVFQDPRMHQDSERPPNLSELHFGQAVDAYTYHLSDERLKSPSFHFPSERT